MLKASKDIIRGSVLLRKPFPNPEQARVLVNEGFHEISMTHCNEGLVLEPGAFTWWDHLLTLTRSPSTGHSFADHMINIVSNFIYLNFERADVSDHNRTSC